MKDTIYHQLATLQTRIPTTLLDLIFSYLNEKNSENRILSEVCKSWNNEIQKIIKQKYPYFSKRFKTGCEGMGIAKFGNKLFIGSKKEICVVSNEGKKSTTFPIHISGKISHLVINNKNKNIYVKDFFRHRIQVYSMDGEHKKEITYNVSKCATQNNKLFVALPLDEEDPEYMDEHNIFELDISNEQVIKNWNICLRITDLVYDENELFFIANYGTEVQVFSENGKLLRVWELGDEFEGEGRGICVYKNNVFVSMETSILTFDRMGIFLFRLKLPSFLLPNMGFYNVCIQNNELFASSEYNNWIYIFQTKKTIKKRKQIL